MITVLGPYREHPYREQIVIFRKIISVPIGNKPKIWVTQKNLDLNLSPITRILLFYEYQDLLNIIKIRSGLNLSYSNRFYVTPVLGNYSSNTEIRQIWFYRAPTGYMNIGEQVSDCSSRFSNFLQDDVIFYFQRQVISLSLLYF